MAAYMTLDSIVGMQDFVRTKIEKERKSHRETSEQLQAMYPGIRGCSSRSVRRFCYHHEIHRTSRLKEEQLDRVVSASVRKVCICSA